MLKQPLCVHWKDACEPNSYICILDPCPFQSKRSSFPGRGLLTLSGAGLARLRTTDLSAVFEAPASHLLLAVRLRDQVATTPGSKAGTELQASRFDPPCLRGVEVWCTRGT